MIRILTINLGTASTKLAVFSDNCLSEKVTINHKAEEMRNLDTMKDHLEYRRKAVEDWLAGHGYHMGQISAISVRVGLLPKEVAGGTYRIKGSLEKDLMAKYFPDGPLPHGSRIILPLAKALAGRRDIPIFTVDPANTNELIPEAKISGISLFERDTVFHALNHRMVCRYIAGKMGKNYEDCRFIVAHLGGGISVAAHEKGRVIDVNNCDAEYGCFSGNRTGTWPARRLISLCFSGNYTKEDVLKLIKGRGGVYSYLGTDDMQEVERRMLSGDEKAGLIFRAMAYHVSKEIGAYAAALNGMADRIILTGGIANSKTMVSMITEKVEKFAEVETVPGEMESEALAEGAYRVLAGIEKERIY